MEIWCCLHQVKEGDVLKILTILTGGTIGSTVKDNTVDVQGFVCPVVDMYKAQVSDDTEFSIISPMNILSENVSVNNWNCLLDCINQVDFKAYDGIILTHGSDTLSFTSAVLGMCFAHINIPLVIVASDYPLEDERSNGLSNFISAVELIKSNTVKGVFVSYGKRNDTNIYLATRLCEADRFCDKFTDFSGVSFAKCKDGKLEFIKSDHNPSLEDINKDRKPIFNKIPKLLPCVQMLMPYPSFDCDSFVIGKDTKALIQLTYHSGTVCTEGDSSTIKILEKCKESKVDFHLCSLKNAIDLYATTKEMVQNNAKIMYNISRESAYAKLILAYSQTEVEIKEFLNKNIFFEIM